MSKNLLLIINEDRFFLSHRVRLATLARENGWDVTLITKDTGRRGEIERMGFPYIELPINPTGMNPVDELKLFRFLHKLFKKNPESVIHLVGLKNMMWGGLASRFTKSKGVLFAVSGLGTLFGEEQNRLVSSAIQKLLRIGLNGNNTAVIFQNHDDEKLFLESGLIGKNCNSHFIKGSGVDLHKYWIDKDKPEKEKIKVVFTARMLKEKGVLDLIEAAELLRPKYEDKVEFILCGDLSSNPRALKREDLEKRIDQKYIKWLGYCDNVPEILSKADIMCFPSYYREGVPKSLLEASAAGLPIITTDSIGCRDTVEEGKNGFKVPVHSPRDIAKALELLILNKDLRESMGNYSRQKAEKEYDVEEVAKIHLSIYESLLKA